MTFCFLFDCCVVAVIVIVGRHLCCSYTVVSADVADVADGAVAIVLICKMRIIKILIL